MTPNGPGTSGSRFGDVAALAGVAALILYALGGLVLLVRFASIHVPATSAVEHVSPQGLVATALINLIGPGLLLGAASSSFAFVLPPKAPANATAATSKVALIPAGVILLASILVPVGWLGLAIGIAIVGLVLAFVALNAGPRNNGWRRAAALRLFAVGALGTALASLAYAYEPPSELPVATAWSKKEKTLAAGYLIAEDSNAVYIAQPGPDGDASRKRTTVTISRKDAARIEISREEDPRAQSSLLCRIIDGRGPCDGKGGE